MSKIDRMVIPISFSSENTPDTWSVIKITDDQNQSYYKVFASWKGGYLDGDRYRFNSGITKVESDGDYFYFYGYSGSIYKCHKKGYGKHSNWARSVLEKAIEKSIEYKATIQIMSDDTDWLTLDLGEL